jgi:hypothetical protein
VQGKQEDVFAGLTEQGNLYFIQYNPKEVVGLSAK